MPPSTHCRPKCSRIRTRAGAGRPFRPPAGVCGNSRRRAPMGRETMTDIATKTKRPAVAPKPPAVEDLSKEIEQSVERLADERVRAVRVFDDFYRCNWWVRDG